MTALGAFAVAVGAVLGAWLRWGLGEWLNPAWSQIPLGTAAANLIGGFIIGGAIEFFALHPGIAPEWRLIVITGFLGGLTTFSTFSAEAVTLLARGQYGWAASHMALHLVGSLVLTFAGIYAVRLLLR